MKTTAKKTAIAGLVLAAALIATPIAATAQSYQGMSLMERIQMELNKFFGTTNWTWPGYNPGTPAQPSNPSSPVGSCYTFTSTLRLGSNGNEVVALHNFLSREGFNLPQGNGNGNYSEATASLVTGFQEKYRSEILTPSGLQYGTGIVGAYTRAKLNALYGCNNTNPNPGSQAPVISGVTSPTNLQVNQMGTWVVSARDPENGPLQYSVVWGDEAYTTYPAGAPAYQYSQQASFTHTYTQPGVFTPTFTVRDNTGREARTSVTVNVGGVTNPQGDITYTVTTDKGTYRSDEPIYITVRAYNNAYSSRTLNFNSGCQVNYTVASYDSGANQACTMALTSVEIPARGSYTWTMTHNPSSYQIPTGSNTITARVIGYGQATVPVTITSGTSTGSNVRVVTPNGGEYWRRGEIRSISWALPNVQYIRAPEATIKLVPFCPGPICTLIYQYPYILLSGYQGTQYNWYVGTQQNSYQSIPNGTYKIEVCLDNSTTTCDLSDGYITIGQ